jgi:pimeloyl-ACP methyl ester carboxylesterase
LLAFMLPKTKYARSGDVRIAYQVTGDGPVDVVWPPGTMSHLDLDWEIPRRALFFERFNKFCRLIRVDRRGMSIYFPVTTCQPASKRRRQCERA